MYVIILAALLLLFVYQIVRKIISRKKSEHVDSDVSFYGITEADEKYSHNSKPRRNSIFVAFAFTWVFWLLGIGLLYKSYNLIVNEKEITKQGNVTNAVVTDVHEYEVSGAEGETKQERDVYLTFTANGQKYDCVIKKAKIYTSVGEQIEIYYDSDDPTVFVSPEDIHSKTHFCMGVILCAIAVYVHIIFFNESKKNHSDI